MDRFQELENEGRKIWYWNISGNVENIQFTEDKYAPVDGYLTGNTGIRAVFELKDRDIPSNKYEEKILEVSKATHLLQEREEGGYDQALYVNIFQDRIYMWDISSIDLTEDRVTVMNCTHTTADNYQRGGMPKQVILLRDDEAICKIRRKDVC